MKRRMLLVLGILALVSSVLLFTGPATAMDYVHGVVVDVDGAEYYLSGPADGPNGEQDIPGHYWKQTQPDRVRGIHFNTGPFPPDNPQWWTFAVSNGELLYTVDGVIDVWSQEKARWYASQGYVHYHELVRVSDGTMHPSKVVWLRHTSRTSFYLDGGPDLELAHYVTRGVDWDFMPNWIKPYPETE